MSNAPRRLSQVLYSVSRRSGQGAYSKCSELAFGDTPANLVPDRFELREGCYDLIRRDNLVRSRPPSCR